jgi:hypothetical protein
MPKIDPSTRIHTVIATVEADPSLLKDLSAHAEVGLERFPAYPGFIGGALHISEDRSRLVQYLQWRAEGDYSACINDPAWSQLPSTLRFNEAVESGAAFLDVRAYQVARVVEAAQ